MKKPKAPINAKTFNQVCALKCDGCDTPEFWICYDGYTVSIHKQKSGEPSTEQIAMPRVVFNRFVRWYVSGKLRKLPQEAAR